jgi:tetratricopeptide (TPR) repeat protein
MPTTIADLVRSGYEQWNNSEALADLGRELEERTRFEVARIFLERSIALDPKKKPTAYISLAYTHFRDNVSHESIGLGILEGGIAATDSDLLRSIFASYLPEDRAEEAVELIRTAQKNLRGVHIVTVASIASYILSPKDALEMLGDIKAMESSVMKGDDVDVLSDFATLCVRLSQNDLVDLNTVDLPAMLNKTVTMRPDRLRSHAAPTFVYTVQQRWPELESAALRALESMPDDESMLLNVGMAAENMGDILKAEQWYNRAIGAKLSFAGARIRLARMWDKDGQIERALNMVREMIGANPGYAFGYVQAATMLNKHGQHDEALTYMTKAKPQLSPWMINSINNNPLAKALYDEVSG